jgi:carboxypeptidase Taq
MSGFDDLMAFQRQTEALAQVAGRLGWDQETVMPDGSAGQRAEEIGALRWERRSCGRSGGPMRGR